MILQRRASIKPPDVVRLARQGFLFGVPRSRGSVKLPLFDSVLNQMHDVETQYLLLEEPV